MTKVTVKKEINLISVIKRAADNAVLAVAKVGAGKAKSLCPADMGQLRDSITAEMTESSIARYGTNVEYAQYVEYGSRPHKAPISALEGWAKRHGIPVGAVWMSIAKKGTKPHRFLTRSADELRSQAGRIYAKILHRSMENG